MNELPEGWTLTTLGELSLSLRDGTHNPPRRVQEGVPLISARNIKNGFIDWYEPFSFISRKDFDEIARTNPVLKGDVLLTIVGSLGRASVNNSANEFTVQRSVAIVRPNPVGVLSYFLQFFFLSPYFQDAIERLAKGTAQKGAYLKVLREVVTPFPPLNEQRRIVAKVEKLLTRVDGAQARLATIPRILKRFRQSVLAAACSGRLTADWRMNNLTHHSGRELVEEIREKRRKLWKERQAAKGFNVNEKDYPNPALPSTEFELDTPDSWVNVSMDELTSVITSGSRDWKKYYRDDGNGTFVMAQNIRPMSFDRSFRLGVNPPENDRDRARSEIQQGDLLVTIVGANTGDACRVVEKIQEHYVCQSVALMRPIIVETSPFIELFLNSSAHGLKQYRHWIYGEGRPHLSFDHLRATAIALPPLAEQQEIVRRVEALFKTADALEARYLKAKAHVDKLTQSILAKAFRGELVPTEAELARREGRDYEPASALLERIRQERDKTPAAAKPARNVRKNRDTATKKMFA